VEYLLILNIKASARLGRPGFRNAGWDVKFAREE
jgi:hypothetical protein